MTNQAESFRRSAKLFSGNIAVATENVSLTYADVYNRASRFANALRGKGLKPGDAVAILGPNGFEQIEQIVGCALANMPRAGLYTYHSAEVNVYLLHRIKAKALIVHEIYYCQMRELLSDIPEPPIVVVMGGNGSALTTYETALSTAADTDVVQHVRPQDAHIIRFSSGTTGKPKPVYHSVERWERATDEWAWIVPRMTERTRYVTPIAIAHLGIGLVWNVLKTGGAIVPQDTFDAAGALKLAEHFRATHIAAAPVMVRAMIDSFEKNPVDLDALECLLYAGSPIAEQTMSRAIDVFGPNTLHQLYAQSEALPATMLFPHDHLIGDAAVVGAGRVRSVGRPTPNTTITVRDELGDELPIGEVGEIAVASSFTMSGIWLDDDETEERLTSDGAVLTRDMGRVNEDGFVYLVDRKDDMIVSGGYNIWPTELEAALLLHPAVADAAVFGVPDEQWGETPKAAVVVKPGFNTSEEELVGHTRSVVGGVKKITSVDFLVNIPRTSTGKLLRGDLKAPYWDGRTSRISGS